MINVIGHKNLFLTISAIFIVAAIACIAVFGFHPGVDFTGGTLWQVRIPEQSVAVTDLQQVLEERLQVSEPRINFDPGNDSFILRLPELSESDHQRFLGELRKDFPSLEELSFQSIGPSVSGQLRRNAIIAMVLVLIAISLYIAFAFRKVSRPVSSWKYALITLLTLFHDVVIPAGMLAVLGRYLGIEIDTNFIVALLVVVGFSVHDTIVVFDRIRENLFADRGKQSFTQVVNESVNQTIARSINTSFTLIIVLVALLFVGPVTLRYFVLTMLVGVTMGIYSSIFVASPILVLFSPKQTKK